MAELEGGYILLSRKLVESEIWDKPPLYLKVWIYILTKAQHKPYKNFDRGELLISIPELIDACSYKVGYRIEKPTKSQIFNILEWLRNSNEGANEDDTKDTMINTTKTTRGMVVKVCNYNVYQDPKKYEHNSEDNDEYSTKTTMPKRQADTINKNDKNDKNDKKSNTPPKSKKRIYENDSIYYKLALKLFNNIRLNNPEYKEPNIQNWSDEIRKMVELDKRDSEKVDKMIDWSQKHSFWSGVVLSANSLRKNYDKMTIQANKEYTERVNKKEPSDKQNALDEFAKKMEAGTNGL